MGLRIGVFYVLTWFFLILLGGVQQETGVLPPEIGLAQWGPGVAGLLMLVLFRKDGHRLVFDLRSAPAMRYVYAALIPFLVGLIAYLVKSVIPIEASRPGAVFESLGLALLWLPLGALGEEIGWRGYLHKKMEPRFRGIVSSLLVGVLWAPIHVHFFGLGAFFVFLLFVMIISYSIVLYALVQDTGFNILLATIFHLSINLTNLLFLDVIYETAFMAVICSIWAIVSIGTIISRQPLYFKPKNSS
jgi:membrane protease YdiL (CAAX protease family)